MIAVVAAGLIVLGLLLWFASPRADIRPPTLSDLPFHALAAVRQFLLNLADRSATILAAAGAAGLVLLWVVALARHRARAAAAASLLVVGALAAVQAQVAVHQFHTDTALALYLIAGALFCAWLFLTRRAGIPRVAISRRLELAWLAAILAVTVFARFYEIRRVPYGADGDETKWTVEVVASVVDGRELPGSGAEYHRRYLPMSFWMQAPFHWVLGAGLTPGRAAVAAFSVLASVVFYLLTRELFDAPTALIATFLLGVSLADLSASRVANVESHLKLWSILPLYGLAVALRTGRVRHFVLTGCAVAGAMLAYETAMPIVAAVATLAVGAAIRARRQWRDWVGRLAALATAPAAVAFVASDYLLGRMQYYQDYRSVAEAYPLGEQLARGISELLVMFSTRSHADWLFFRNGPYINGLLIPLLLLGVLLAIAHARHRGSAFVLTWAAWVFIPIPILLHSPLPRILYAGLPALFILIALAVLALYRAIAQATGFPRGTAVAGVAALGLFGVLNLTIWFQEMGDPYDEVRRREVAELVAATIHPGGWLLMPYVLPGETVEAERDFAQLIVRERRGLAAGDEFRAIPYRDLLPTLSELGDGRQSAAVLVDTSQDAMLEERAVIDEAFRRCYSPARIDTTFFQLYTIDPASLAQPACRSARLQVEPPPDELDAGTSIDLRWSTAPVSIADNQLECSRSRPGLLWIEPEHLGDLQGWITDVRFVTEFSGAGYVADDIGSRQAAGTIDVPADSTYRLWVRSLRRQFDPFPAFLEIAGQPFQFAEAESPESPAEWRWQSLGEVALRAGPVPLRLARPFDPSQARFMALFVDSIVLARDLDFDPARDDRWQPMLQMRGPAGAQTGGSFQVRLEPGRYRCAIRVSDGDRLVDETGTVGLYSDPIEFEVRP